MTTRTAFIAAALLLGACYQDGNFPKLARAEKAAFNRCNNSIVPRRCAGNHDLSAAICADQAKGEYASQPTAEQRQQWLADQGCPDSLIVQ